MASSAIKTAAVQLKAGNIQNQADTSAVYSDGEWSFKNSSAVASVTISDAGDVGIGTSSPTNFGAATTLTINSAGDGVVNTQSNGTNGLRIGSASSSSYLIEPRTLPMRFLVNGAERMRIDANGNLLVGTTSANAQATFYSSSNWAGAFVRPSGSAQGMIRFYNGVTFVGSITTSTTNTTYNTGPSDYRLKEQIQDLSGGLEKVKQLRPVSFKWKESGKEDFGFIAHEIASVIPECVTGEKDAVDTEGKPEYQTIFPAPAQMIASLVKAIQELSAKVEEQSSRIEAQAAEIEALKAK